MRKGLLRMGCEDGKLVEAKLSVVEGILLMRLAALTTRLRQNERHGLEDPRLCLHLLESNC